MQTTPQPFLDGLQRSPHAIGTGMARKHEPPVHRSTTDVLEPKEVEGLRLAESPFGTAESRETAELEQPGLFCMQRQGKLLHSTPQIHQELFRVGLVLEADDEVVGVAHDDDLAASQPMSPSVSPQVEDVVQI